jgi:hypothetical protein
MFGLATDMGLFVAWQRLPPSPHPIITIVQTSFDGVIIRSNDQQLYQCSTQHPGQWSPDRCWARIDSLEPSRYRRTTQAVCHQAHLAFWPMIAPPQELIQCIVVQEGDIDVSSQFIYARDADGFIWRWFHWLPSAAAPLGRTLVAIMLGICSFGIGLFIAWSVQSIRQWRSLTARRQSKNE